MGEGKETWAYQSVLGIVIMVRYFVFCVTLAKDDPSGRSIWARMRPDAGSLGMYCISSAYPNFTLPDAVQAAADDGQRAQQTAPDTLTLTGTDGSEAQVSEIITTEETAPGAGRVRRGAGGADRPYPCDGVLSAVFRRQLS